MVENSVLFSPPNMSWINQTCSRCSIRHNRCSPMYSSRVFLSDIEFNISSTAYKPEDSSLPRSHVSLRVCVCPFHWMMHISAFFLWIQFELVCNEALWTQTWVHSVLWPYRGIDTHLWSAGKVPEGLKLRKQLILKNSLLIRRTDVEDRKQHLDSEHVRGLGSWVSTYTAEWV